MRRFPSSLASACLLSLTALGCGHTDQDDPSPQPKICQQGPWQRLPPPEGAEFNRAGHATTAVGDEIIVVAGHQRDKENETNWFPPGRRIQKEGKMLVLPLEGRPPSQNAPHLAAVGDEVLLWGNGNKNTTVGRRLTDGLSRWELLEGPVELQKRYSAVSVALKSGHWFIFGGRKDGVERRDGFVYDANKRSWAQIADAPYPYSRGKAVAISDSALFVWGGWKQGATPSDMIYPQKPAIYSQLSFTWSERSDQGAPPGCEEPIVQYVPQTNEVLVWSPPARKGARFNLKTRKWEPMSSAGGPPQFWGSEGYALLEGERPKLVVSGPTELTEEYLDVHVYDVLGDTWSKVPPNPCAPPPRLAGSVTAFADGSSLLFWGGSEHHTHTEQERGWILKL